MNISENERREVAGRLRNQLFFMSDDRKWYEYDIESRECGNRAYRNIAAAVEVGGNFVSGNYIHVVERLIGLIDRPTCRNVYDESRAGACANGFECSECGNVVEDCEGWLVNGVFNYCSKCGAEVVE